MASAALHGLPYRKPTSSAHHVTTAARGRVTHARGSRSATQPGQRHRRVRRRQVFNRAARFAAADRPMNRGPAVDPNPRLPAESVARPPDKPRGWSASPAGQAHPRSAVRGGSAREPDIAVQNAASRRAHQSDRPVALVPDGHAPTIGRIEGVALSSSQPRGICAVATITVAAMYQPCTSTTANTVNRRQPRTTRKWSLAGGMLIYQELRDDWSPAHDPKVAGSTCPRHHVKAQVSVHEPSSRLEGRHRRCPG